MTFLNLINEYWYFLLLIILAASATGFFAGLFGIGGGLISVPFLFFIFGTLNISDDDYLMHLTVGTAFSITILTSASSVLMHKKNNLVDFEIVKSFGKFVIVGVVLGAFFASFMNTKNLVLFFTIVVFFFGAYLLLLQESKKRIKSKAKFYQRMILGLISGFISAPIGITGAMINVPILRYFGYPIGKCIGTSAAIGFLISLFGATGFLISGFFLGIDLPFSIGFINIPAFILFVPITTYMARVGANTVNKMNKLKIQRMFGIFLYVIGIIFLFRYLNI